jgi:glucosamine-6-phosphate deaminase
MGFQWQVFASRAELAQSAAERAAELIRAAVASRARARVVLATGNSQLALIDVLTSLRGVPWHAVEIFHMDEYVGVSDTHPASFRKWIRERVANKVNPASAEYMIGDAPDIPAECSRYSALLLAAPVDLAFVGIGENGHIAFNDPHVADFDDPETVKVVEPDEACRRQQVGEGHFSSIEDMPKQALTMTCPALMRAEHLVCSVPEARKARAVAAAMEGPLSEACPASILRTHPDARVYLDHESAAFLSSRASR